MRGLGIASILLLGFVCIWFGLVDDVKVSFALAIVLWATATLMMFSGKPGVIPPPRPRGTTPKPALSVRDAFLPASIPGAFVVGFIGVWFGLVDDVKLAMLAGVLVWAGAVLATFRGRADIWRW